MIAASVALMASFSAVAGLGGLNVQSHLGEPFSGTVTVTGDEAKILLSGGKASISDNRLSTSVRKSGDNAIVSIRSSSAVRDPVLVFQMGVGAQARQYTAIIDPPGYASGSAANRAPVRQTDEPAARASERGSRPAAAAPRAAQSRPAPAKVQERQNTRVAAGEYTVRSGETLMGIASRVRPAGLSSRQTMLALVQANPEIFESGSPDRIWPGNVLIIPAAEELHRLAKPGEPAPVAPAEPVPTPAASEPVAEPASAPVAAPVEDSAPVVTASEAVAQPASEPVVVPAPQPDLEPEPRESGSWWRWLLLGGLGLIALWMLSKMLGKKHKTVVFKDEDDTSPFDAQSDAAEEAPVEKAPAAEEGIRTHQPVARPSNNAPLTRAEAAAALAAGKVATDSKGKSESSGLEVEDDFDGDIFFTDVEKVAVKETDDSINLDLGSIDSQQNGILSGAVTRDEATEQRKEVDWEQLESTESVYEPDESAPEAPLPTDTVSAVDIAAKEVEPEKVKPAAWAGGDAEVVDVAEADFASDEKEPVVEEDPFAPLEFDTEADEAKRTDQMAGVADEPATESWYAEAESAIAMQEGDDVAADVSGITLDEGAPATIEWDESVAEAADERSETGFITESVGMTAPLEAKYELAKMYIEIGDPEAARDTLLELMEESDGGILAKAQALLDELDAS